MTIRNELEEIAFNVLADVEAKMDRSAFVRKVAEQCKPLVSGVEACVERRVSFTFSRQQPDGEQFQPAVHDAMREYMSKAEAYRPFESDPGDNPGMDYSASNGVRIQIEPLDLDPVGIAGDQPMPDPLSECRMPGCFDPAAKPFLVGVEADEEPFSSAAFVQEFIKP